MHAHTHTHVRRIRTNGRLSRRLWEIDDRHGFTRDTIEEWKLAKIDVCGRARLSLDLALG